MAIDPGDEDLVPLGEGPAATVLAGVDEETGQAFALKVYRGKLDRRTRAELDDELVALKALRGSVPILVADVVEETFDGRCVLRMELCSQSLWEFAGSLDVGEVLALGETLASALAGAHRVGIVHGGVTPGNVLFRPSGEAVLADFGLVLRRAFPRDSDQSVGFVPPETLRDGTADERSDLYGLGAVLYFALEGRPPYQGVSGEQQALRVLSGEVPGLERAGLPAGLAQLVTALLARNPDARPLDAATVAGRLGAMIGPPVAPRPQGEPILVFGPGTKQAKSRSGLVIAVLAVLSVFAVIAVLLLSMNSPAELDVPPPATQAVPVVQVDLTDPVDGGSFVDLSWRSSVPLDFAVIVAAEGKPSRTEFVRRGTSFRVPVDPVGKYCFLVQGTDSRGIYESKPKPIRGAVCKK